MTQHTYFIHQGILHALYDTQFHGTRETAISFTSMRKSQAVILAKIHN
jgi:hypothetical protein